MISFNEFIEKYNLDDFDTVLELKGLIKLTFIMI